MKTKTEEQIVINEFKTGKITQWIEGEMPMIFNSMSTKVMRDLLLPKGKKTAADKAQNLKHDPMEEYVNSTYRRMGEGDTRLIFPCSAIKSAIANAALEIPGAKKSQIGRLVWVEGDYVSVYGVPKIYMAVVRSADMNKTPDVRTRAILPKWCCKITISYVEPTLNSTSICQLLSMAGMVIGLGDFRQEKGKGNFGRFHLCDNAPADIVKTGGIKQQDAALENPEPYDVETESLLGWFNEERVRRGK